MDETKKTGIFWGAALVMLMVGMFVAWPTQTRDDDDGTVRILFEKFTDPLAASNMKVVTFDEEKGELEEFVVRKDPTTELWTIESKGDYPADALEQVKKAANSLISLKVLDVQTTNAEDHAELGVIEPDMQKLQVGDEGVGRLVSFKDKARETLASIIIGKALKDDPEKRFVRIPGQDPVYVVRIDPSSFTTDFQDWVEDDLLQLSSIDVGQVTIDDYSASISPTGKFSMDRKYVATVKQNGSAWEMVKMAEYEQDSIEPKETKVDPSKKLNVQKLNDLKNTLDDLKFVSVRRKPQGMSASLRANEDLLKNDEALASLITRGFFPVAMQAKDEEREVEIVSANGELRVATTGGVQYTLRFGNVNTEDQEKAKEGETEQGVNRYLLVTTSVDESQFPAPELAKVIESVDELKKSIEDQKKAVAEQNQPKVEPQETQPTQPDTQPESAEQPMKEESKEETKSTEESKTEEPTREPAKEEEPKKEASEKEATETEPAKAETTSESADEAKDADAKASEATEGSTEDSGEVSAEGSGSGQDDEAKSKDESAEETKSTETEAKSEDSPDKEAKSDDVKSEDKPESDTPKTDTAEPASEKPASEKDAESQPAGEDMSKLTDEEWQELLEAEQEKISKANQRLMDDRKDKMKAAEQKARELNARFADWYYVIPESTYNKLRLKQADLFESEAKDEQGAADTSANGPSIPGLNIPGLNLPNIEQ
jgi:Domain of unknown function (DUF4340)